MMQRRNHAPRTGREGFALMMVLFVLLALLVLAAPFLMTARTAERAGAQARDRAQARITLDAAARHTRVVLEQSHPALDPTPWYDDEEELDVSPQFPESFLNPNDPNGAMWDVESEDLSGRVDLSSASPGVIANLLDLVTLVSRPVAADDDEIKTAGLASLSPQGGLIWVNGELIRYGASERGLLKGLSRGQRTSLDEEDKLVSSGPRPSANHPLGQAVFDERALALMLRRISIGDALLPLDSYDQLEELNSFIEGQPLDAGHMNLLREATTPFGGLRGGAVWQQPSRIMNRLEPNVRGLQYVRVSHRRWFTPGTTVMVTDGLQTELRIVLTEGPEGLLFDRKLQGTYERFQGLVYPLSRRPVNINTASPLVLKALFTNLGLRGQNRRIDTREAESLTALVVQSRPFAHMQDFLERVVIPAAGIDSVPDDAPVQPAALEEGEALIDTFDAEALYRNALNANDRRLSFSTMPFCFSSRDVYAHELRATINAPTGVERASARRRRVELVAPQGELLTIWNRQEDFDELLRLPRGGAYWMSGPEPTTRWDQGTFPPSRFGPHWGSIGNAAFDAESFVQLAADIETGTTEAELPVPRRVFGSREDDGFLQLWPARDQTSGDGQIIQHFDFETRALEGRYLPDETIVRDTESLNWSQNGGLLQPFHFSLWMRERDRTVGGLVLDVSAQRSEVDRVSLTTDADDLVLRVFDGFGDHPDTDFQEITEVRYGLQEGDGPGFPVDVWQHVSVDVAGSRPDQVTMLVNGQSLGVRYNGMSRLASALSPTSTQIVLESGDGFPDQGVVRIGNEVIEYTSRAGATLICAYDATTGRGGRLARERFDDTGVPPLGGSVLNATGATSSTRVSTGISSYDQGTPVSLYGYSVPLLSSVLTGGGELQDELGPFAVARIQGLTEGQNRAGDPVTAEGLAVPLGFGIVDQEQMGLVLVSADSGQPDPRAMAGFNPGGGYALICQRTYNYPGDSDLSLEGLPLNGMEIVRYDSVNGFVLNVVQRGDAINLALPGEPSGPRFLGGTKNAFVVAWEPIWTTGTEGTPIFSDHGAQTFILPISVPLGTSGGGLSGGFVDPLNGSAFAQLTRLDDPTMTEWVRYDEVDETNGDLVRSNRQALFRAFVMLATLARREVNQPDDDDDDNGGFGGGGNNGSGGGPGQSGFVAPPPQPPPVAVQDATNGTFWSPVIGESEIRDLPLSLAVSNELQFRGVMDTFAHTHPAGTQVLPVFSVADPGIFGFDLGLDWGRPGAGDAVFLGANDPTDIGFAATIHRAHAPRITGIEPVRTQSAWEPAPEGLAAVSVGTETFVRDGGYIAAGRIYYAFEAPAPNFLVGREDGGQGVDDSRVAARLVKFPSGELPRLANQVGIGTGSGGSATGAGAAVPSAVVDEIRTVPMQFGNGGLPGTTGGSMQLAEPMSASDLQANILSGSLRTAAGLTEYLGFYNANGAGDGLTEAGGGGNITGGLPTGGGLLRIGEEILAFESSGGTTLQIAPAGRGLLGTEAQPHYPGESIQLLETQRASVLSAPINGSDFELPVIGSQGFGAEGTVLVGGELIHFTRNDGTILGMPARSEEAGAMDNEGAGIFRGRYGTAPSTHVAGTPVISFPVRYWDRWNDRTDAPELSFFGFELDQPGAYWLNTFYEVEDVAIGGSRIEVLVRSDPSVPWDADPDLEPSLQVLRRGLLDGEGIPIGGGSDRLEWRAYVRYQEGAFDAITGRSHGWKTTPRLRYLGAEYMAPRRVLESVDQ